MIAVDTSVLIRYFVQDDFQQAALATRLLEERLTLSQPGVITSIAIYEVSWVLQRIYKVDWNEVRSILIRLLGAPNLIVEHHDEVAKALAASTGFGDAMIHFVGRSLGCSLTMTLDKKFARLEGVELLVE